MSIWKYEHRTQPLASPSQFLKRLAVHGGVGFVLGAISLLAGMVGYRLTEGMTWLDAFVNAAMILGGMGPVGELHTTAGKLFAGCYALFSGVVFLLVAGVMIAPLAHRLMHRMHLEEEKD